jgi:hypothetical protein
MNESHAIAVQALRDALAIKGLEDGGGGFVTGAHPRDYMSPARLTLAKAAARMLPPGASMSQVHELARDIAPRLIAAVRAVHGDGE